MNPKTKEEERGVHVSWGCSTAQLPPVDLAKGTGHCKDSHLIFMSLS